MRTFLKLEIKHIISAILLLLLGYAQSAGVTVAVPEETTGTDADAWSATDPGVSGWYFGDIRNAGTVGITTTNDRTSPQAAIDYPGSSGSLEFSMSSGADKAGLNQYFTPLAPVDAFPLSDLVGLSYDWYRDSSSTNSDAQAPAIFIWISTGGNTYGLKYEPIYNGFGPAMPTDAWQTSAITDTTNLWSWNAPTPFNLNPFYEVTLAIWKTVYPDAVVTGMGVDVGSGWNGVFSGFVDFIAVDRTGTENDLFYDFQVAPVTSYTCLGFKAPLDKQVIVKKKNRVLPLRMELVDDNGDPVSDITPPVLDVIYQGNFPPSPGELEELTYSGKGDEGNQFSFDGNYWSFNLSTKGLAPGTYYFSAVSGNASEYEIDPTCEAVVIIAN